MFGVGLLFHAILVSSIVCSAGDSNEAGNGTTTSAPQVRSTSEPSSNKKYSSWTKWSPCSRSCDQKRFRTCISTSERECSHGPFHVQLRNCSKAKCHQTPKSKPALKQVDDLLGSSTLFEEFFFTSWARWTHCYAKECKQYRWKLCSFYPICGERLMVQQRTCPERLTHLCLEQPESPVPSDVPSLSNVQESGAAESEQDFEDDNIVRNSSEPSVCGISSGDSKTTGITKKIFGGKASSSGRWPWQVVLLNQYMENYCAGTLISNWVLTAAHCVRQIMASKRWKDLQRSLEPFVNYQSLLVNQNRQLTEDYNPLGLPDGTWAKVLLLDGPHYSHKITTEPRFAYCTVVKRGSDVLTEDLIIQTFRKRMFVKLGEHHLRRDEETEQLFRPTRVVIHRNFDTNTIENDIALLKISDNIRWGTHVHPVCLPDLSDEPALLSETTKCVILGWGKRKPQARFGSDVLHEANVEVVEHQRCREAYQGDHPISSRMMCAGSGRSGRSDTCEGDSGGPLLCQLTTNGEQSPWKIVGITSFGDGCGKRDKYGVYTRVSSFLDWIKDVTSKD